MNARFLLLSALAVAGSAQADRLDINLAEHALGVEYDNSRLLRDLHLNLGTVHHEDDGDVVWGGIQVEQKQANFRTTLGARAYYIDTPHHEWSDALALGGGVVVNLLGDERLTAGAEIWYAPPITSGRGADNLSHFNAGVGFKVMDNAKITAGWREIRTDYKDSDHTHTVDRGFNLGLSLLF